MRLVVVVLLVLQAKLTIASGDEKEHVHFKIYVPEIIKHHVHTKTVFIHVHEPKKKSPPKKNEYVQSNHDDWSIWNSYSNYDDHGDRHEGGRSAIRAYGGHQENRGGHYTHQAGNQGYVTPHEGLITAPGPPPPPADNAYPSYYRDDYKANDQNANDQHSGSRSVPLNSVFNNGVTGYSHPPQYQIHENVVEDIPNNSLDSYKSSHEEGHSKRHHSETGHLYTNELENFHDDKHVEASESVSTESKEVDESSKDRDSYRYVGAKYITTRRMIR